MLYFSDNMHGGDIYQDRIRLDFSVNIHPFGTPEKVQQAIRDAADQVSCYPDPCCRELVQAVAAAEEVPEEWILCGNGAAELIYTYCLAAEVKMAAEPAPAFSEYAMGTALAGGSVVRYPLKEEDDFLLDESFLDFLGAWLRKESSPEAKGQKKTVFLCNPNNPDGRNIPFSLLTEILTWCRDHGADLFLDECFLDMSDHPESMKNALADHPQLFLLRAFTKSYGMAGVRLGYCLSSDHGLLKRISARMQPWNVSVPAQMAGIAALQEKDWIEQGRSVIRTERPWVSEELKRLGFRVCRSESNYLLFRAEPGLDAELRKQGIAIRSCGNLHHLEEGWYRIGLKRHEENEELIQAIRRIRQG